MDIREKLILAEFFPYQLSVLYLEISKGLAQLYANDFDLSRQEWRVMGALGNAQPLSANEVWRGHEHG